MSQAKYPCPCCAYYTLDEEPPGTFRLCEVCWWEDDPIQLADHDYTGGANGPSLKQAKQFFRTIGTSDPKLKGLERPPRPGEIPPLGV